MLMTWGGNGLDTIHEDELQEVGYERCAEYCREYCWPYGYGSCPKCAFDKEREKRKLAEMKGE